MTQLEFKYILQQPYCFSNWKNILSSMFNNIEFFAQKHEIGENNKLLRSGGQLGMVHFEEKNIALFEIEVADNINIAKNRKQLRDIAAYYIDQNIIHGALVWYYSSKQVDYRLSYIEKHTEFDENGQITLQQTAPKRYTFTLGQNESCTTASMRLLELSTTKENNTLKDVSKAFNVEKLNKDFFNRYKDFYKLFYTQLSENSEWSTKVFGIPKEDINNEPAKKPIRDFVKKMMGRIVFLHFLQKKGWMGCPSEILEWKSGDPEFMLNLYRDFDDKPHFYSKCLVELFFNTLNNRDRNQGVFPMTGTRVPYLNGGLFDEDFPNARQIDFPENLFADLLEFFAQYNFTIDENSPEEQEVGIDPEMLGHIFENLLEDNKERGTFYTPKEIVHYMCQESLIGYLKTNIPDLKDISALEGFIRTGDIGDRSNKHNEIVKRAKQIEEFLDNIKICDPAIGSGAFPMGMLHEIFKAKLALDLTLDRAKAKKDIIQNSIYGVDIEKGAVDIARLRFWLSLVVDEEEPQPLPNLDFKIMQGNSLLEEFEGIDLSTIHSVQKELKVYEPQRDLFGNLIDGQSKIVFNDKLSDLSDKIKAFFNERHAESKATLKNEINQIVHDHIDLNLEFFENEANIKIASIKANRAKLSSKGEKQLETLIKERNDFSLKRQKLHTLQNTSERPYFLWHLYFLDVFEEGGFDIVIGNPPYLRIQGIREIDPRLADRYGMLYKSATGSYDLYTLFTEKSISLIKERGIINFIMPVKWTNAAFGNGLSIILPYL